MREMIMCENSSGSANNSSYDVPSTSTGITGTSSSVYRVIEQDSDEEAPPTNVCTENNSNLEDNFVDIIPTPLNGSHDMYINMIEMPNNINNSNAITMNGNNNNNSNNVVTLRNEDYTSTSSAGHSHSVKCDSGGEDDEYSAEFASYINENGYSNDTNRNNNNNSSYSDSDQDYNYTPVKKRRRNHSEIDSGFATGSCSSNNSYAKRSLRSNSSVTRTTIATSYNNNNNNNDHSSDDDCHYEKFKKRVKKARVNIRKQIGGDSDSN
ncbi:hypothetical protein MML48_2g00004860 [Holotrichia oblita]|uniref:Uncharacterized protein n=1 Tax=Holotrichia oblita TaxID=644536 RepID=A0ACB9TJ88_HOLOL|nr:hypothetical protein MML48_2g00004860 [Holotrichia oblita]